MWRMRALNKISSYLDNMILYDPRAKIPHSINVAQLLINLLFVGRFN